jgi:hypothetical protein
MKVQMRLIHAGGSGGVPRRGSWVRILLLGSILRALSHRGLVVWLLFSLVFM